VRRDRPLRDIGADAVRQLVFDNLVDKEEIGLDGTARSPVAAIGDLEIPVTISVDVTESRLVVTAPGRVIPPCA
jgi:hypothetical protein